MLGDDLSANKAYCAGRVERRSKLIDDGRNGSAESQGFITQSPGARRMLGEVYAADRRRGYWIYFCVVQEGLTSGENRSNRWKRR